MVKYENIFLKIFYIKTNKALIYQSHSQPIIPLIPPNLMIELDKFWTLAGPWQYMRWNRLEHGQPIQKKQNQHGHMQKLELQVLVTYIFSLLE